ncbi:MAG: hypothetical protein ACLRZG_04835 [Streptococcus sp.]
MIDTTKFAFGRYYQFDIPATVKRTMFLAGADIENTAASSCQLLPTQPAKTVEKPDKPTENAMQQRSS